MILRPKPQPEPPPDPVARLMDRLFNPPLLQVIDPRTRLFPTLYQLVDRDSINAVLRSTHTLGKRKRSLPAHEVVWLTIAQSLFRDRSIPMVWRHVHPSSDQPLPVDSAFTQARQRLGALPLKLLFHRTCRPLARSSLLNAFHRNWLVVALDGTVIETPDSPANRKVFGSSSNQNGEGAFPQVRMAAICEVGSHAITDVEMGPYARGEISLSLRVLKRLRAGRLVLMDRGLSYYELIHAVRRRNSHVLARVKSEQRDLPVEEALPDGSYLSTIYPSYNDKRARRGGMRVRVVRYTHDDPNRDGQGEQTCLLTTILSPELLSAREAVLLYPWRWEEESVFAEIKQSMLQNKQPLLRSKDPTLVVQEIYGMLIGHYVIRRVMAEAALRTAVSAVGLSFKRSLEMLEDRMKDEAGPRWLAGLVAEVGRQKQRPRRPRRYRREKKASRSRWPNKKPGTKRPPQPTQPFAKVVRIIVTDEH